MPKTDGPALTSRKVNKVRDDVQVRNTNQVISLEKKIVVKTDDEKLEIRLFLNYEIPLFLWLKRNETKSC